MAEKIHPTEASFDADENSRRQIAFLIDRLSARFGEHRVQCFVPQDTHIPEAQSVAVPAQDRDFDGAWTAKRRDTDPPLRPLRLLEKPEEIHSVMASVPDGPPARFQWRQCRHEVVRAEGPERIALEWWQEDPHRRLIPNRERLRRIKLKLLPDPVPPSRDYFRVETRAGQRFWLYRDGQHLHNDLAARWYLHGIFA